MNADFIESALEPSGPDCPVCGSAWFYAVHHDITGEFLGDECGSCGHEAEPSQNQPS
jgi:ribosomal protein S27AE